jgi:hypothetical protein
MSSQDKMRPVDPLKHALNPLVIAGLLCSVIVYTLPLTGAPDEWMFSVAAIVIAGGMATLIRLVHMKGGRAPRR